MDFTVPTDHWVKKINNENSKKYLKFAIQQKNLEDMWVDVILIVVAALGRFFKVLERRVTELEIRGKTKTIQNTLLLR